MVHVIQGYRPWSGELQAQCVIRRKWERGSFARSCCNFAAAQKDNLHAFQKTISTGFNCGYPSLESSVHLYGVIGQLPGGDRSRPKRNARTWCFESSSDGICANELHDQARTPDSEAEATNYYTEAGLEVVKSLEGAEVEVLKAILSKENKSLASTKTYECNELPLVVDRSPYACTSVSAVQVPLGPSRDQIIGVRDGASVDETREEVLYSVEDRMDRSFPAHSEQEPSLGSPPALDHGKNMLQQMREIFIFAGPALGIWLSGPIMSLIDTSVIGTNSSLELAALGPGTVLCDQLSYVFMFLSVATSNLIASSLAQKDEAEAARHLAQLLFISLVCGVGMYIFTEAFVTPLLQAFVGVKNASLVPASRTYVKIRALAWPAVLVGLVAQSASFGMQDSWSPLKVLVIASLANAFGDIVLCKLLGYGIAGAAWATMVSQYIAGILMLVSLRGKGYNVLTLTIPSLKDLVHVVEIAAPVLLTMLSKVLFYTLITYLATSLGTVTLAAHQVMIGIYSLCTVWGEPLAQTAQSFMPALIRGANRDLQQARVLLNSLLLIGALVGVVLGTVGIIVPWFLPHLFTGDVGIVTQMRSVTLPFFCSILITAPTLSLEGTLLAARDLKFLGLSMASCFCMGSILLLAFSKVGFGLQGSWWTLTLFQSARFLQSYTRVNSPASILNKDNSPTKRSSLIHQKTS